jgi:drug/metabolite transporter (DMT)-like permease
VCSKGEPVRLATLAGVLLIIFGVVVLALGLRYRESRTVVEIGELKARVTEQKRVPNWVGAAAVVGGVILVAAGTLGQRRPSGG